MAISVEDLFHSLREQLEYRLIDRPELTAYFAFERSFGRSDASPLARLDSLRGVGAQRAAAGPGHLAHALHAAGNSDLVTTFDTMRQSLEDRICATPEFRGLVALEKALRDLQGAGSEPAPEAVPDISATPMAEDRPQPETLQEAPEVPRAEASLAPADGPIPPPAPLDDPAPVLVAAASFEEPPPADIWNASPAS